MIHTTWQELERQQGSREASEANLAQHLLRIVHERENHHHVYQVVHERAVEHDGIALDDGFHLECTYPGCTERKEM